MEEELACFLRGCCTSVPPSDPLGCTIAVMVGGAEVAHGMPLGLLASGIKATDRPFLKPVFLLPARELT